MKHFELNGKVREVGNKAVIKAIRKQGLVPCNLYGPGLENVLFTVTERDLMGITHTPASFIIDIKLDNGKAYKVLGDYKRDGRWCSFDIPVKMLKAIASPLFADADGGAKAFIGNVFAVLSGGITGTELQFDNIFFYKRYLVAVGSGKHFNKRRTAERAAEIQSMSGVH